MKKKDIELDVDSIGSQDSALTKEEKRAISDFIRKRKADLRKCVSKKTLST